MFSSIAAKPGVRTKGLEPPRRVALDPKSSASTNSATSANRGANIRLIFISANRMYKVDDNICPDKRQVCRDKGEKC